MCDSTDECHCCSDIVQEEEELQGQKMMFLHLCIHPRKWLTGRAVQLCPVQSAPSPYLLRNPLQKKIKKAVAKSTALGLVVSGLTE